MLKHLQQLDTRTQAAGRRAGTAVRAVSLKANKAFLLVLVLVIIPTITGVALIA